MVAGKLPVTAFATGSRALDYDDRIIFNPENGAVLYDADGSRSHLPVQIATLVGVTGTVTAADFILI
jgi:hypothetical protein